MNNTFSSQTLFGKSRTLPVTLVAILMLSFLSASSPTMAARPVDATSKALTRLPASVATPGYLDKKPAPNDARSMFYLFQPPEPGRFGVAEKDGTILWQKTTGLRSLVDYFWAEDGKSVIFVTDCLQTDAELRFTPPASNASATRSWFFILDAVSGKTIAEGDLDTDVLDLAKQLPEALGASHLLKLELKAGILHVSIDHCGKTATASRPIAELPPRGAEQK
ncbi:MAG: hypothetical protein WA705_13500 [Candidatus Ozemobacteraceae bacterium]